MQPPNGQNKLVACWRLALGDDPEIQNLFVLPPAPALNFQVGHSRRGGTVDTTIRPDRILPIEVRRRLNGWFLTFWFSTICHYLLGIGGVVASTIGALNTHDAQIVQTVSLVAAGCMAVLGFAQPDRNYRKFVTAWRLLDDAAMRYRYSLIDIEQLLNALRLAEASLQETENQTLDVAVHRTDRRQHS